MYKFRKTYISTKGESENFYDIVPENITVNYNMPYSSNSLVLSNETCINEVKIKPFSLSTNERQIIDEANSIKPVSGAWMQAVYNTLKRLVFQKWNPKAFHIILHSGGYDSRIISTILRDLTKQHGREWLGKHIFVECAGESKESQAILKLNGFSNFVTLKTIDYYPYSFAFGNYKDRFNGYNAYPVNIHYDPLIMLEQKGIIPANYQVLTGFGAYSERAIKTIGFVEFFKKNYYYHLGTFNFKGEQIMPYFEPEYMFTLKKHKDLHSEKLRTSQIICDNLLTHLKHIKRPTPNIIHFRGLRKMSVHLLRESQAAFDNSVVGKGSKIVLRNDINYTKEWAFYNAARLVKELKK